MANHTMDTAIACTCMRSRRPGPRQPIVLLHRHLQHMTHMYTRATVHVTPLHALFVLRACAGVCVAEMAAMSFQQSSKKIQTTVCTARLTQVNRF